MFKYCPKCKAEINFIDNHFHCDSCGFDYYNTPNPAASVLLINQKKQIYLAKRAQEPKAGCWDIPGGFVDFYESAETAAHREMKEELGIELTNLQYFCSCPNDYLYKGTQYYPLDIFFISWTDLEELVPIEKDELLEGKFFDLNEVPLDAFAFESQKQAMKDYLKLVKEK